MSRLLPAGGPLEGESSKICDITLSGTLKERQVVSNCALYSWFGLEYKKVTLARLASRAVESQLVSGNVPQSVCWCGNSRGGR